MFVKGCKYQKCMWECICMVNMRITSEMQIVNWFCEWLDLVQKLHFQRNNSSIFIETINSEIEWAFRKCIFSSLSALFANLEWYLISPLYVHTKYTRKHSSRLMHWGRGTKINKRCLIGDDIYSNVSITTDCMLKWLRPKITDHQFLWSQITTQLAFFEAGKKLKIE